MNHNMFPVLIVLLFTTCVRPALAAPVQWLANGHFYEVVSVPETISWEDASAAATAAGGYLATVTSRAENDFVFNLINNPAYWHGYSGPWVGGYQSPATQQAVANWRWVTGEAWSYTNWQPGQPNDSGGSAEDKLQFGFGTLVNNWNDIQSVDPTPAYRPIAYVVEWESDPLAPLLEIKHPPVQLCWQTATNRFYHLLYCSVLAPGEWLPLSTNWIKGDGTRHCDTDPTDTDAPQRFYRLLCTNAPPS